MMELGFLDMSKLYLNLQYSHQYVKKRSAGNVCFRENQVLGESKLTISEGIISEHNNRYHLPPSFLSPLQVYHLCVLYRTQYLFSHYPSPKTNTTKTAWMNTSVCICIDRLLKSNQTREEWHYIIPTSCSRLWCAQNVGKVTVWFHLLLVWLCFGIPSLFYNEYQNLFSCKWLRCYRHTNLHLNRMDIYIPNVNIHMADCFGTRSSSNSIWKICISSCRKLPSVGLQHEAFDHLPVTDQLHCGAKHGCTWGQEILYIYALCRQLWLQP